MEADLIDYLTIMANDFLELNPKGLFVCGGDPNRWNLDKLTAEYGQRALVDFPIIEEHIF